MLLACLGGGSRKDIGQTGGGSMLPDVGSNPYRFRGARAV